MSIRRAIALSGLILVSAAPFVARADATDKATDACIAAFVETYVPAGLKVHVQRDSHVAGPLDYFTKQYVIALSARFSRSGEEIAQARCIASARGDVIVLDRPAPETYIAKADVKVQLK
jgi:hypothetical protein